MNSLNTVIIDGNLTKDVEYVSFQNGGGVAKFAVALNRSYKTDNGEYKNVATFVNVSVFGKIGELCKQYLEKGRAVRVMGSLETESWKDKDGKDQSRLIVRGNSVEFGAKPKDKAEEKVSKAPAQSEELTDDTALAAEQIGDEVVPF